MLNDSEGPSPIAGLYPWMALMGLFALLSIVVFADAIIDTGSPWSVPTSVVFVAILAIGAADRSQLSDRSLRQTISWLAALSLTWTALVWMQPAAAYLGFPLYILILWLLPLGIAMPWVILLSLISIAAVVSDAGWTPAGVVGPLIGFGVAVGIAVGYRVILSETARRGLVIQELRETRNRLAVSEREAGRLAERARLAREIHDTTAQGLTSIQMLLHAAEMADPNGPGIEQIRLARETAATELAETRLVINALAPAALEQSNLEVALNRLADTTTANGSVTVTARISGTPRSLALSIQAALLRIAQGAVANVAQHARATSAQIRLAYLPGGIRLEVVDNGCGFRVPDISDPSRTGVEPSDHFGLSSIQQRVSELDGDLTIDSAAGEGTRLSVLVMEPS